MYVDIHGCMGSGALYIYSGRDPDDCVGVFFCIAGHVVESIPLVAVHSDTPGYIDCNNVHTSTI